jgi:hypothetical protein
MGLVSDPVCFGLREMMQKARDRGISAVRGNHEFGVNRAGFSLYAPTFGQTGHRFAVPDLCSQISCPIQERIV